MKKLNNFIFTAVLGGFLVILPLIVIYKVFMWLTALFSETVSPSTTMLAHLLGVDRLAAELIIFGLLLAFCFLLGVIIKTTPGLWMHDFFEKHLLARIPGYRTVKDIIWQFSGRQHGLFRKVVRVSITDGQSGPFMTGLLTDEYHADKVTVFIPTGPNPTTGIILHTKLDNIVELDVSVEAAMKSIISCGAGSGAILNEVAKAG